ncbi:MAG TPA: hypothetical protein VKE74_08545 [Gemmataceae bacterium]|nr:hypothetical protein [Gemmataceae bacterium]
MARSKAEGGEKMTQVDMVKAALDELGAGAKPLAIQEYVKSKFNKDLSTTLISNYKSVMKRKAAGGHGTGNGRRRGRPARSGGIHVEDLETVRGLVRKLGADQVRRLVAVFA